MRAQYIVFTEIPFTVSLLENRKYPQHRSSRDTYIPRLEGKKARKSKPGMLIICPMESRQIHTFSVRGSIRTNNSREITTTNLGPQTRTSRRHTTTRTQASESWVRELKLNLHIIRGIQPRGRKSLFRVPSST